jgi:REP element-mobilizing transposase RayT
MKLFPTVSGEREESNMPHSYTKLWIHLVFGTKERIPLIQDDFEEKLHTHIRQHLENDFGSRVRIIGGTADHIHILFLLNPNHTIKDIAKNIKGESSHWLNQQNLTKLKFSWQIGYGAFSVSESNVDVVEQYIGNQKEHHKKKTFRDEFKEFMSKHGLKYVPENDESFNRNNAST